LSEVLPSLKGKFDGWSLRVPTMDVSIVDLSFQTEKSFTKDSLHAAMKEAADGPMKGILGYETEQLVSSDYLADPRSSIFDSTQTLVLGDNFAKVFAWYDNEWGFSNRMIELAQLVAKNL
jgi:glyceraldehyde 3-phosphate dehydrogenase